MEWAWKQRGKTACINYPTVIGAMTLYNITKDDQYVQKAKTVYAWPGRIFLMRIAGRWRIIRWIIIPRTGRRMLINQASCIGAAVMVV